ncbi:hypothetical protein ASE01_10245 [Nocardioides sp. Root190]|uniref:DUF4190 domain-containing protein n=1 Tax=Nocardioides sp. Root190 TaxID=1736488 RepID=UPI0006F23BE0|nr:DUF4190 domain-containing protein [Nocardioides sp. Root190]KRB77122.1 hypothetical protein ASE01_10245 [Nocardioides sp. Root190]
MSSSHGGYDSGPPPDPYPPPGGHPLGFNPYDPRPGGWTDARSTDGISIASLVCSLTCCAGPVGIGLGIAGIVRTKDARRSGRWAAVTGLVLGIVGTILAVGAGIGLTWYGTSTVFLEDARAGDCIDVGEIDLWKRDCDEPHDAEVVHAGRFDDQSVREYIESEDSAVFCEPLAVRAGYVDVAYTHILSSWVDSYDVDEPQSGDHFICVAESYDGQELDGPLSRGDGSEAVGSARWWSDLQVGDCFNDSGPDDEGVGLVQVVDCTEDHDFQHIGQVQVYGADWPGEDAVEKRTDACLDRFATYLKIDFDDSYYDLTYYTPTAESWESGERIIVCIGAGEPGEKLTETLKGIAE